MNYKNHENNMMKDLLNDSVELWRLKRAKPTDLVEK